VWTGFFWFKTGTRNQAVVNTVMNFQAPRKEGTKLLPGISLNFFIISLHLYSIIESDALKIRRNIVLKYIGSTYDQLPF
jgi:hypothetical protein